MVHFIRTSFKVSCGEFYRSSEGLSSVVGRCVLTTTGYINFYNIYNATLSGVLIPSSMLIFGVLTIRNVRQLKRRVDKNSIIQQENVNNRRNFDYQLSLMILVQLGVYLFSNLPYASYLLYVIFTMNSVKSSFQTGIDNLYMNFAYFLVYINFAANILCLHSHISSVSQGSETSIMPKSFNAHRLCDANCPTSEYLMKSNV